MSDNKISALSAFTWSIAELLRGDFKQSDYGKVVLPFVVMRRLDCLLEKTKDAVLEEYDSLAKNVDDEVRDMILYEAASTPARSIRVYNFSRFTFKTLLGQDAGQLQENLNQYISGFSPNVREIFQDRFRFPEQLKRLDDAGILYQVFKRFAAIDLHPDSVSNTEMGYLFEELIRRFAESSNETAGEHFTPREVIALMVELLTAQDDLKLSGAGKIRRIYDPACGTGGMLAQAEETLTQFNDQIRVELFGQEINDESFAICKSDMLITGHDPENIQFGNSLTDDKHAGKTFHYMISNPPYGVDWKKYEAAIKAEHKTRGFDGRFGPGLPRVSDGQLLFLLHMISKMRDDEDGSRIAIVMNGSPLFTGGASSGESEIRRWMFERDLVEAIVALPTDLFYNTGIQTYVWLLNNRKPKDRTGLVQLIDASSERFWQPMRKSLGSKRREIPRQAREEIVCIYAQALNGTGEGGEFSKVFRSTDFGYREIRVERPLRQNFALTEERLERLRQHKAVTALTAAERDELLAALRECVPAGEVWRSEAEFDKHLRKVFRQIGFKAGAPLKKALASELAEKDETAEPVLAKNGGYEPDADLRDQELVPLAEDWREYFEREVRPYVPDAWVDESHRDERDNQTGRVGYEINFNRYFYQYAPPRPLEEINAELKTLETEIAELLREVAS